MLTTDPTPVGEKGEIRCFCSRSPLLAVFGVGKNSRPFIHVKVWKQNRLYTELVISGKNAETSIKCRDCYRWYRIFITETSIPSITEVSENEVQNADSSSVDSGS
jgi:hypothetical protein